MIPLTLARVAYSADAWAARETMQADERRLLSAAIAAIKNGPEDGACIAEGAEDDTVIRQMSAQQVHVQYAVTFWAIGRVLLITFIEIRHWEPLDDSPTMGTRRRR